MAFREADRKRDESPDWQVAFKASLKAQDLRVFADALFLTGFKQKNTKRLQRELRTSEDPFLVCALRVYAFSPLGLYGAKNVIVVQRSRKRKTFKVINL